MPNRLPNPSLFPAFVAQHTVAFDEGDARDMEALSSGIAMPSALASAVPKRRVEFAAGRYCARTALQHFMFPPVDVGIGAKGEPLWPEGIVGAITHTHGYASVAIARTTDAIGIGLDAERWMGDDVAHSIAESIASSSELEAATRMTEWSLPRALTLIFSAKETVFKCFFPQVRRYFDFRDAVIHSCDPTRGEFTGELLVPLTSRLGPGYAFSGRFEYDGQLVRTAMVSLPAVPG